LPAPWPASPTASAPACGANFHVPSICAEKLKIGAKSKKYSFFMLLILRVLEVYSNLRVKYSKKYNKPKTAKFLCLLMS
jgi:hypothetical protein